MKRKLDRILSFLIGTIGLILFFILGVGWLVFDTLFGEGVKQ